MHLHVHHVCVHSEMWNLLYFIRWTGWTNTWTVRNSLDRHASHARLSTTADCTQCIPEAYIIRMPLHVHVISRHTAVVPIESALHVEGAPVYLCYMYFTRHNAMNHKIPTSPTQMYIVDS